MRLLIPLVIATLSAAPLLAHEFWIEPQNFQVESGDNLVADFRNGEKFRGGKLSWFDHRINRSELRAGETVTTLTGRAGDMPAINQQVTQSGLLSVVHISTLQTLIYREPEKFQAFVDHKDLDTSALPDPSYPLSEGYIRFAKSLIAVDGGAGRDAPAGLELEFVALKNPYTDDLTDGLPIALTYQSAARADAQVEVFARAPSGEVEITLLRTDAQGHVVLPVKRGYSYLIDSVLLRRPDQALAEDKKIDWESLWAALTFAVPD